MLGLLASQTASQAESSLAVRGEWAEEAGGKTPSKEPACKQRRIRAQDAAHTLCARLGAGGACVAHCVRTGSTLECLLEQVKT